MTQFVHFLLLGVASGALVALAAQGLVLTYRGSGVVNFAHVAIGMSGAYLFWEVHIQHGQNWVLAFVCGVTFSAAIGALMHVVIMRRLRHASPLTRVAATLGVLVLLQGIAIQRYGASVAVVKSIFPTKLWRISGSLSVPIDRVWLFAIACGATAILWAVYKFSAFGLSTRAVAENQRAASALSVSPDMVAAANWALGCGISAAAAILLAPVTSLSVGQMTNLLLGVLAAALIGNFSSFSLTLVGGIAIGVVQTEFSYYSSNWGSKALGLPQTVPFVAILLLLVVRGQALPLRDFFLQRQPKVGSGRISPILALLATIVGIVLVYQGDSSWAAAWVTTFTAAILLLSIVVVTGYGGQISLAQFAIAGFGAWFGGRYVDAHHVPFLVALVLGVVASAVLGALFALPAVRTRGINLAILTLALGSGIQYMLFSNSDYTGGANGTVLQDSTHPYINLFGWRIDGVFHAQRYAAVCLVVLVLALSAVGNLRRGRSGRRLLAVRANERAAASLGINVVSAKVFAFSLGAAIAGLGGVLMLFRSSTIDFTTISNSQSTTLVALAVIGGLGYLLGPLVGSLLFAGSVGQEVIRRTFGEGAAAWLQVFAGAFLILLILQEPDGIALAFYRSGASLRRHLRLAAFASPSKIRGGRRLNVIDDDAVSSANAGHRVEGRTLGVENISVRYGSVMAVDAVTMTIRPGRIVSLIGPNGAGKTSLVDAISGFTATTQGRIVLDGQDITRWSPTKRARAGVTRTFQSLELFDDMSVIDNLRAASDSRDMLSYARDLVFPKQERLRPEVLLAISEFGLADILEVQVEDLSYGQRRLLAVARAIATHPSVLLLDECAAGLSETESRELAILVRRLADEWGMSILLIEHDVNFVMSVSDDVVVLDFGRTIAQGIPEVVREDPAVIRAYLGDPEGEVDGIGRDAAHAADGLV